MSVSFSQTTSLINQTVGLSNNAHELDPFEFDYHGTITNPTNVTTTILGYYLDPDTTQVPNNLVIDSNGLITGLILPTKNQPDAVPRFPDEVVKLDGSNWMNNGSYINDTFTFHFTVRCEWQEQNNTTLVITPGTTLQNVSLMLIKDHTVEAKLFVQNYLTNYSMNVNGEVITDYNRFLQVYTFV